MKTVQSDRGIYPVLFGVVVVLVVLLGSMVLSPALAQKSKKAQPPVAAQMTIKEVLQKYQGRATNIGTLSKVAGDCFVLEQEGVTAIHPIAVVQAVRLIKLEEGDSTSVEIYLLSHE
jgi:hypothetical protein